MTAIIQKVKRELMKDPMLNDFIKSNNLTDQEIVDNLSALITQRDNNKICNQTENNCLIDPPRMRSRLVLEGRKVIVTYYEVLDVVNYDYLEMMYFPHNKIIKKSDLIITANRALFFKEYARIDKEYNDGEFTKGVYVHGTFGTGKSYLLTYLAQLMTKKNVRTIYAYYPDLVRFIKSNITSGELEQIVSKLKNIPFLILDDVGAEHNSPFIRDEILGPILQHRIDANLPVCMSSNLSLEDLREHFSDSKDSTNKVNSDRIVSRIRYLMNEVALIDKNYRVEN